MRITKRKTITAPILVYSNLTKPFILTCDASNYAISAILSYSTIQGNVGRVDLFITCAFRTLNKSECNYSVTKKEYLAFAYGTKFFRPYLIRRQFNITSDNKPLNWLFNCKDPESRLMVLNALLGLAHSTDTSTLFRGRNSFGLRLKK